ncbi:MmgE/PrpD family protein [Chelativorans sp. AA-79]|uniref:MmgE/PrpD family protein n=1 Tax=Chelativorans sp. AA-79 TaxID=3028735 RepID=UPI0023F8D15D|nr:MmgE/PrpD family protein [Chelativorans sp. AA-79]WEX08966.1 MmgE/PrpD family protein [Chelativorans sp. AA-79]
MHFLGALFSNCAAASALDVDDGHRGAASHPGAAIIPAVLMEAERRPVSREDLLAAIIIGYEVAFRIGEARRLHEDISFASGIWICYGLPAVLGRLQARSPTPSP